MRKKKKRFEDNAKHPCVIEQGKQLFETIKGRWADFFGNTNPIVLELGCGTGKYTVTLAKQYPQKNFVGVDIKGARMWVGAQESSAHKLANVAFLRTRIEMLARFFAPKEVDEIYITFPDPHPKEREAKRRLTSERFLAIYKSLLKAEGHIHLKTDNDNLYKYTLNLLQSLGYPMIAYTEDLYAMQPASLHTQIQTLYEQRFLAEGRTIKYIRFGLPDR